MRVDPAVQLVGTSEPMLALRKEIASVARSNAKVLITGESGSGKEVVAREIHAASRRAQTPLIVVNCAGLPETLLESELFGHVRGSFTGAYRDRPGKLELAHQGTVFLDEIGDMTPRMQALLLRFIESGEIQKVGAEGEATRVQVRLFAATNRSITDLLSRGELRQDLFHRLNVMRIDVPPLRERKHDIPLLVSYFLGRIQLVDGAPARSIAAEALAALAAYSWPGNVRELQNAVERMAVRARGDVITLKDLSFDEISTAPSDGRPLRERRRTPADDLYARMVHEQHSFWTVVYPAYMRRDLTRDNLRALVEHGLRDARGNWRVVASIFNIEPKEYKKFLNFLRKQQCQPSYREFR